MFITGRPPTRKAPASSMQITLYAISRTGREAKAKDPEVLKIGLSL